MRASWFHLAKGKYPLQARVSLGDLYEEHVSRRGFVGSVAMLYHQHGPNEYLVAPVELSPPPIPVAAIRSPDREDPAALPLKLYSNEDVALWWSQRSQAHPYVLRNLDGDQLYFVHQGSGVLETEFGQLRYRESDFLYVPKAVTYRLIPDGPSGLLLVESNSPLEPFDIDAIGRHAPYDPTVLEIPEPDPGPDGQRGEFEVRYKVDDVLHRAVVAYDPLDVVGWKGDMFPFRLNMADIMPIHSERSHLAPSVGGVFRGEGFIVANLLPQPAIPDLEAEELPDYHRNVDYDEFWLTHVSGSGRVAGEFFVTTQGFVHGASEAARRRHQEERRADDRRERTSVGVDTVRRLRPTTELLEQVRAMVPD